MNPKHNTPLPKASKHDPAWSIIAELPLGSFPPGITAEWPAPHVFLPPDPKVVARYRRRPTQSGMVLANGHIIRPTLLPKYFRYGAAAWICHCVETDRRKYRGEWGVLSHADLKRAIPTLNIGGFLKRPEYLLRIIRTKTGRVSALHIHSTLHFPLCKMRVKFQDAAGAGDLPDWWRRYR